MFVLPAILWADGLSIAIINAKIQLELDLELFAYVFVSYYIYKWMRQRRKKIDDRVFYDGQMRIENRIEKRLAKRTHIFDWMLSENEMKLNKIEYEAKSTSRHDIIPFICPCFLSAAFEFETIHFLLRRRNCINNPILFGLWVSYYKRRGLCFRCLQALVRNHRDKVDDKQRIAIDQINCLVWQCSFGTFNQSFTALNSYLRSSKCF